jgi:hypothetical protein
MTLPKSTIPDLVEDLRELSRAAFVETFPDIPQEETTEAEAADVLEQVEALLVDIVADDGQFADRARAILNRQE